METTQQELEAFYTKALPGFLEYVRQHSSSAGEIEIVNSLDGITSIPVVYESGGVKKYARAPIQLLKTDVDEAVEACNAAASTANTAASVANSAATAINTAKSDAEAAAAAANSAAAAATAAKTFCDAVITQCQAATQEAISSAATADNKASLCEAATTKANDVLSHPSYIGTDYHVYRWDYTTSSYIQTSTVLQPSGFSIYRTYASIDLMNTDLANVSEGKFVIINTGSVNDVDTAKLYVRGASAFEYLVDLSGTIGADGKTVQFSIGTVTEGTAAASLSADGNDSEGNPKFKINLVVPRGNTGFTPRIIIGNITTLDAGTSATASITQTGTDTDGAPVYTLALSIPRGAQGNVLTGDITSHNHNTQLSNALASYVAKIEGKGLSTNDFTTELLNKLNGLSNYDDSPAIARILALETWKIALTGTSADDIINTFNEVEAFLQGITGANTLATMLSSLRTDILNGGLNGLKDRISIYERAKEVLNT